MHRAAEEQAALNHTCRCRIKWAPSPWHCLDSKAVCLRKQLLFLWWFLKIVHKFGTVCQLSAYNRRLPSWLYSALNAPQTLKLRVSSAAVKQTTAYA